MICFYGPKVVTMPRGRYKLILFDLDGTLLDSAPDVHDCINQTLEQMKLPQLSLEEAKRAIGPGADNFSRAVLQPAESHRLVEFMTIFRPIYRRHCLRQTRPFDGMVELLHELRQFDKAVVSNKSLVTTEAIVGGLGLKGFFRLLTGPECVEHIKPAPDMIQFCLRRLRYRPEEALVVGDTDNDVLAARAAGTAVCAAGWGYARQEELLALRPDFYVRAPAELKALLLDKQVIKATG
jgi:phosphoglycolate phosphatase